MAATASKIPFAQIVRHVIQENTVRAAAVAPTTPSARYVSHVIPTNFGRLAAAELQMEPVATAKLAYLESRNQAGAAVRAIMFVNR